MPKKKPLGALILHGFTASLDCVREIEPPLTALGLPTRMPVLRGHGAASPDALRGVTWHDWLADAGAALDDLLGEAEKAVVIGHSLGGLLTLMLAADHPEKIDSIVTAAAAVQMTSPMAPGHPLSFLIPLMRVFYDRWPFLPPVYADMSLARYNTNYPWAPTDALQSLLEFSRVVRRRLPDITAPALILQSRKDSTVAPESAEIIYRKIATPPAQKRIVWFDKTEHEMFRDCERAAAVAVIASYARERMGV